MSYLAIVIIVFILIFGLPLLYTFIANESTSKTSTFIGTPMGKRDRWQRNRRMHDQQSNPDVARPTTPGATGSYGSGFGANGFGSTTGTLASNTPSS